MQEIVVYRSPIEKDMYDALSSPFLWETVTPILVTGFILILVIYFLENTGLGYKIRRMFRNLLHKR